MAGARGSHSRHDGKLRRGSICCQTPRAQVASAAVLALGKAHVAPSRVVVVFAIQVMGMSLHVYMQSCMSGEVIERG